MGGRQVLLQSENYVTKRKALKLLHEMLIDRRYQPMMLRYVSSKDHLKVSTGQRNASVCFSLNFFSCVLTLFLPSRRKTQTVMNMLKQKSVQIQFE